MTALVRTTDSAPASPLGVVARDAQTRFLTQGKLIATAANENDEKVQGPSLIVARRTRQRRRMARS